MKQIVMVGVGKIAQDQHLPVIRASKQFEVCATVDPNVNLSGVPAFDSIQAAIAALPHIDCVAICTPPKMRVDIACAAMDAGLDVLLEKPPAVSVEQLVALKAQAERHGVVLYTAWHSQHAPVVEALKPRIAKLSNPDVRMTWIEDVRKWHPGQAWIWQPEGMGVFDPGMNGLSILSQLSPEPLRVEESRLWVPENQAAPHRPH